MTRTLEVAIAAGGTAGHINPALALAEELSTRGHHVTFYGQPNRLESRLVPEAGYDFEQIRVTGFDRSRPWTLVSALVRMRRAERQLQRGFGDGSVPDVAVGFGAYVEMPLLRVCRKRSIPYVIHEQNSVAGLANRTCARDAATVCISFPDAKAAFEGNMGAQTALVVTGNPVRRSVIEASRRAGREAFGVLDDELMVLVFGGSLGARHLNEAMVSLAEDLLARPKVRVVHSTGNELFSEVEESLGLPAEKRLRWDVRPYIDNMGEALAAADLVISRAGASSIAEIAALAVPSVLVPYPLATGDHQTTNARLLVDAGAAELVNDADLDGADFHDLVLQLVDDDTRRVAMRDAARALGQDKAAAYLADQVEAVC
ncbi:MAG: undecaprenyldiphospho-muramoylpentapeptide beta-N-acetylglucosaminyltransferase [Atopobiaceae bacterium]|nr:undecaprenyldiphospho-muramoylpentapeptide beta-N-acetylglucosaminyltransferase [Atopobiaceae bacterium]